MIKTETGAYCEGVADSGPIGQGFRYAYFLPWLIGGILVGCIADFSVQGAACCRQQGHRKW